VAGTKPKQSINSAQVVKRRRDGDANGLREMEEKRERERAL